MGEMDKHFGLGNTGVLCFYSLFISLIFSVYIFSSSNLLKFTAFHANTNAHIYICCLIVIDNESCDLFDGRWVPDKDGPLYSNYSCPTIPTIRNCFFHGRKDRDFLYWRWKPEQCQLPRFDSKAFLSIVRGKTMAFIGDSIARNQMESLVCLLSMEESPTSISEDPDEEEKFTTAWHFPHHNFTLKVHRSVFLVRPTQKVKSNGYSKTRFHLLLDQPDPNWTQNLSNVDFAIFSDGQWFLRPIYLHEAGNLTGCIFCREPNVQDFSTGFAIRKAFKAAFKYVNERRSGIVVFVRTFSPSHFEHGAWHNGGFCNRTRGLSREEVKVGGDDWEYRNIQVEEFERAKRDGEKRGNRFELMDVTRAMMMRPDGHPGEFWGNKWMKGHNDCLHWCLPGPIDTWNELLLQLLRSQHQP
ncbi:PREDICTED: protein ALTERED XYLOGLUCAN 4-like [Ipomoea nil]|uniref:protein ALTERED XYLOGLUCAN 4-like n=1 Tax=Ipomoea nil TaxID=35883 RepID=UPI000900FD76|nr:PREDICTED: protein ALTERED XYLOGLUCAN 4-like [Ipomoea nil]